MISGPPHYYAHTNDVTIILPSQSCLFSFLHHPYMRPFSICKIFHLLVYLVTSVLLSPLLCCVCWWTDQEPLTLSVTQSAFASTSDRPLCFPRACVGLIGPRPSDYPHALSACYYFLPAVFLLALGLWSSLPARQLSLDTPYSFLTFSVFFFFFFFLKY